MHLLFCFSLFFRKNVLSNLPDKVFDRPICEALLNQKYFNGIGNYLRAEILYRLFLTLLPRTDSKMDWNLYNAFLPTKKLCHFIVQMLSLNIAWQHWYLCPKPWRNAIYLWEHCVILVYNCRSKIPPFMKARTVLEGLEPKHEETMTVKVEPSLEAEEVMMIKV